LAEGNYGIIYRAFAGFIEIDAVLHGYRDIPAVLRDREPEG
jgi:plasmid stabilization system protein ParE